MNLLDLAVATILVVATWGGWRLGLVGRVLSWVGLLAGLLAAFAFVDDVAQGLRRATPQSRLVWCLLFVGVLAATGQALGLAAGRLLEAHLPGAGGRLDRAAGAAVGFVGVLVAVWLLTPALASTPGWPADAARSSFVVRGVDRLAPAAPDSAAALGRLVGDEPFPEVFERLTSPDAGEPPGLAPASATRAARSVVKVEGRACDRIQQGSGFVAAPDVVVTNAHVVAGETGTVVTTSAGRTVPAVVVAFDPDRDVAVLHADGLDLPALTRDDARVDATSAVVGYPGGGPQRIAPARVAQEVRARGSDIYRTSPTERDVLVLASRLAPGFSGGPLLDADARVVGLAFAIDPSDATTAYALTRGEVDAVLDPARGRTTGVATGSCLVR